MPSYAFRKNSSSDPRPIVLATTLHHSRRISKHPGIFTVKKMWEGTAPHRIREQDEETSRIRGQVAVPLGK